MKRFICAVYSLAIVLMAMASQLGTSAGSVTATVNKTWLELNVTKNGEKGVIVHTDFTIKGCRGKSAAIFIYCAMNGDWIKGTEQRYTNSSGTLCIRRSFTPSFDSSNYSDYDIFIPYKAFAFSKGTNVYTCEPCIYCNNELITMGEGAKFTYTYNGNSENKKVTAKVNSSKIEHDIVQDGKKGMRIHANFNVYNGKGKEGYAYVFITDSDGNYVKGKGSASCTKDGSVFVKRKLTPSYENSLYEDLQLFFPLEHIKFKQGKNNYNCIVYINFENDYIANGKNLSFIGTSGDYNNQNVGNLASVELLNNTSKVTSGTYRLKAGIKSDSKIEDVNILVNGQSYRGISAVNNDGYDMVVDKNIDLVLGSNTIIVEVKNAAGLTKVEKMVSYVESMRTVRGKVVDSNGEPVIGATVIAHDSQYGVVTDIDGNFTLNIPNDVKSLQVSFVGMNEEDVPVEDYMYISMSRKNLSSVLKRITVQKRLALVVGNSNYAEGQLKNPVNDAMDLSEKLKSLGFDVISAYDQTNRGMVEKIREFGDRARNYDVALFFYAGHGIQHNGVNYLIPVDSNIKSETDIEFECTDINRVLAQMDDAKCEMKIVILDACRNNPFERSWHRSASTRGLSFMKAPKGTFITYATAPGDVALDGSGRNSPYTEALLQTLDVPNLSIFEVFQRVLDLVSKKTNDMQNPWQSSSFKGDFYFNRR